jgi:hypothetical protein
MEVESFFVLIHWQMWVQALWPQQDHIIDAHTDFSWKIQEESELGLRGKALG